MSGTTLSADRHVAADPPLLLDVRETARLLGLSVRATWRLTSAGRLRAVRIGRATRWRREDIEQFVEGLE